MKIPLLLDREYPDTPEPTRALNICQGVLTVAEKTWQELLEQLSEDEWSKKKSGDGLEYSARKAVNVLGPNRRLSTTTAAILEKVPQKLQEAGLSPHTINKSIVMLNQMIAEAQEQGLMDYVPSIRTVPIDKDTLTELDSEEEHALLECMGGLDADCAAFAAFVIHTGLRADEALALRWSDVEDSPTRIAVVGSAARVLPLSPAASAILEQRREAEPTHPFGNVTLDRLRSVWNKCRPGKDMRKDILRTTWACRAVRGGLPLTKLATALGVPFSSVVRYKDLADASFDHADLKQMQQ